MYDYRLWILLKETTEEGDCGQLRVKVDRLRQLVEQKLACVPRDCIYNFNYSTVMQCTGGGNHRGQDHYELIYVLEWIAESLPGSYGLVYWVDDEDPEVASRDQYRVITLARGRLEERRDPFFSPISQVVGD